MNTMLSPFRSRATYVAGTSFVVAVVAALGPLGTYAADAPPRGYSRNGMSAFLDVG